LRHGDRGTPGGDGPAIGRSLVLHADDFGMNEAVTEGILQGFRQGLLTSTAILTNAPDCVRAITQWKELQSNLAQHDLPSIEARERLSDSLAPFDLGIHLNLTQGRPLTAGRYPALLLDDAGRFPGVFGLARRVLTSGWKFRAAIERELTAQIEVLLDHRTAPTHLNAHQYIDLFPVVAAILPELLRRYSIRVVRVPWERSLTRTTLLRRFEPANWCLGQIKRMFAFRHLAEMSRHGIAHPAAYFGTSHAGRINFDLMQSFVAMAGRGLTEIGMHPGCPVSNPASVTHDDLAANGWHDPLALLRSGELSVLTSPALIQLLETRHIHLGRLSELAPPDSIAYAE
jgi:predicted glycoside hydrolase/deacetylase ChbG (UPF0249 family)